MSGVELMQGQQTEPQGPPTGAGGQGESALAPRRSGSSEGSSRRARGMWAGVLLATVVGAFAPLVVGLSNYHLFLASTLLISFVAVSGIVILLGHAGQISLATAAFVSAGAYGVAIGALRHGINPLVMVLVMPILVGLVAYPIGYPILRLKGFYLAIATLALGAAYEQIVRQADFTNSGVGFNKVPRISLGGFEINTPTRLYYLFLVVAVGVLILALNLVRSRFGEMLRAIRDSEEAARALGINAARCKSLAFSISAATAALAGTLHVQLTTAVSPETYTFGYLLDLQFAVIIGGMTSVFGALFGSALFVFGDAAFASLEEDARLASVVLTILVLMLFPRGLAGIGQEVSDRVVRLWSRRGQIGDRHGASSPGDAASAREESNVDE